MTIANFVRIDRSRVVTRQGCPKRRYLEYDKNGTGFSPVDKGDALPFGIAMHVCMEKVLRFYRDTPDADFAILWKDIQQYTTTFCNSVYTAAEKVYGKEKAEHKASEQTFLLEMLVYGWTKQRLPKLLEEYNIEQLEQEFEIALSPDIKLMLRIDAVLRNKANNLPYILDFKSLSTLSDDWMVKQTHSAQSSLYIYGLEQHSGEYVAGIFYEGLAKGAQYEEKNENNDGFGLKLQATPLCYVYENAALDKRQAKYTKAKGYRKMPAWKCMSGVPEHYAFLREQYEGDLPQFCFVPPVRPPQYALDRTVQQTIIAEREYYAKLAQVNAAYNLGQDDRAQQLESALFELHYDTCYKYGSSHHCAFAGVCHGGAQLDDPELFVPRTPHHAGEFEDE